MVLFTVPLSIPALLLLLLLFLLFSVRLVGGVVDLVFFLSLV